MLKSTMAIAAVLAAFGAAPAAGAAIGPDAAACNSGRGAAALVRVDGFKQRTGTLRIQAYPGTADQFLAKGEYLRRIDLPVTGSGPMQVCVALPHPGQYAFAVRHDVDGSGKSGWSDGGGFSRNPKLSLTRLKPSVDDVKVAIGPAPRALDVTLNYRRGLSIGPAEQR